jgi:hypothetical protein
LLAHESRDAPPSDPQALPSQRLNHARAAVSAPASLMNEGDLVSEFLIALNSRAWRPRLPGVISAFGELKSFA